METQPPIPSIAQWIAHLDALTSGPLSEVPLGESDQIKRAFIASFRDEFGSRGETDGAVLSRVLGVEYEPATVTKDADLDVRLWDAVHNPDSAWRDWISEIGGKDGGLGGGLEGGLVKGDYAIEHRTLLELSSLHAMMHLADHEPEIWPRIRSLVDWHTRELQPDNGVNRPWGFHAFIVRSVDGENESVRLDAMLHAQTLVSNCCVTFGKPDVLSAVILRDGADSLRSWQDR